MRRKWACALALGAAGAATWAGTVLATDPVGVTTTPIATKVQFGEIDVHAHTTPNLWRARIRTHGLSDAYVVDNKFPAVDPLHNVVANTGWHRHPGPSLVMVIAGTVTNYDGDDPNCTPQRYNAGQGFIDSGSDVHILRNEDSVPAETIAVQLVPKDAPRKIDVTPAPGNCPF